jgi:putative nucleotidyltransferase with HDIG domain
VKSGQTIPGVAQCAELMNQYHMLSNIRRHSIVVARLADQLISELHGTCTEKTAIVPDRNLVIAGALLHDIAKTKCLDGSCNHATVGAAICRDLGYPEVAQIVEEHVILKQHDPLRYKKGIFLAQEIVYYADKRVLHDKIVSLDQRLEYILDHYGQNDLKRHTIIQANFSRCVELEFFLFQCLDLTPEKLGNFC